MKWFVLAVVVLALAVVGCGGGGGGSGGGAEPCAVLGATGERAFAIACESEEAAQRLEEDRIVDCWPRDVDEHGRGQYLCEW